MGFNWGVVYAVSGPARSEHFLAGRFNADRALIRYRCSTHNSKLIYR